MDDEMTNTSSMLDLCDVTLGPLRAAVIGHRTELIAAGIDPQIADEMALDAHQYVTSILITAENRLGDDDEEEKD